MAELDDLDRLKALEDNPLDNVGEIPLRRNTDAMNNLPASKVAFEFVMAGFDASAATAAKMMREVKVPQIETEVETHQGMQENVCIFPQPQGPRTTDELHAKFAANMVNARLVFAQSFLVSEEFKEFLLREAQGVQYGWKVQEDVEEE